MKKILCLTALLIILFSALTQAQIRGTVSDAQTKEPLTGAVITESANGNHCITDNNGNFHLNTSSKTDSIVVIYAGYVSRVLPVTGAVMNITMHPSLSDLNEIVVSANRDMQTRTDVPMAISAISKTAINETKATQLDQLLNRAAGVYMVDLGNQQHAMAIRQPLGYNNYFLYMEDGIPIRTGGDFNHNALIEINDAATERIEIIKGPASALYGSEAVGGAVNFITQAPSLTTTAGLQAEAGSYGYKRANFFASGTVKKLGLYVGGYYADRDASVSQHNDFHKLALNLRADYAFSTNTKLTITAAKVNYYTDQKGGLDSAHFFDKQYVNDPASNQRFTYRKVDAFRSRATLDHAWNEHSKTSFTAYYRNNAIGQNPFYDETYPVNNRSSGQINVDAFSSYGTVIQHVQQLHWLNAKWITGVSADISPETYKAQYILINVTPQGVYDQYTPFDSMLVKYGANLYNTAVYTQMEVSPVNKLKIVAGLRYDRLDYSFSNYLTPGATTGPANATNHFAHITPRAGLTYDFEKNKGVYANYSIGFAPPDITDLYSGYVTPDLKPSTFYNYEAGGWLGVTKYGYIEASVYRLNGSNELVPVIQPNGISLSENAGKTQHTGLEVSINYNPVPDIFFRFSGTYVQHRYIDFTDGSTDVANKWMANAPPFIINSQITYKPHYFKGFLLSAEWQSVAPYYTDPENLHKYNGYNIFNLRAAYKIKSFELWANCLNAANKVYATIVTYGYGKNTYYPGMLQTFNVGVGYTFSKEK